MSEFLAEAQILIQANTVAFKAELAAALATVPKAIEIPVVAVGGKGGAAAATTQAAAFSASTAGTTAALEEQVAASQTAGAATQRLATAEADASAVGRAFAATQKAVALANLEVIGAATETQAAQIKTGRAAAAGAAARDLLTKAELHGADVESLLQKDIVKTALAYGEQAAAAKASAQAQTAAGIRAAEIQKGLQAQALASVGLRGAIIGANTAFIAAAAGAIAFGKALQSAAQFQTELATFGATTGATAGQLQQVSEAAKQLGEDVTLPGVSAQDAAVAMTELAKAGLSVQDSIAGARGILQLATAAQIDNAQATELAASALNAFGLSGSDAVQVADTLANAANDAQGSITDIGIALQQASAAGRQAGLSLQETTGILTVFARNGIKGSDAGTLLRTLLIRLINPTKKADEVIQKLGLHLRDATGGINLGFFDEFARKTRSLTAAERDRDAAIIGGQDAFRGISILAREGGVALDQQIDSLNKSGTAADVAAARTSGLAGSAENLKNQLSAAGLALGQTLTPGLTSLTDALAGAVAGARDLVGQVNSLAHAAASPIDFVVHFIEGNTGEDVGKRGFFDRLVHAKAGDLPSLAFEATFDLEQATGIDLVKTPTIKQARDQIQGLVDDINKSGGSPRVFNDAVVGLQKIQKELAGGTAQTKEQAKALGPFIDDLQKLSATPDITIPIKIPAEVLGGAPGKQAAEANAKSFGQTFIPSVGDAFKGAASAGWQAFQEAGAAAAADAARAVAAQIATAVSSVSRGANQQAGLEDLFNKLLLSGASPQQQSASLQKQFANQQAIIDKATKGLSGLTSQDKGFGTLTKAVRAARAKQVAIQGQITQINETAAADAKQKATEAQQAATKADQAVLDSFSPGQNRITLAQTRAGVTGSVKQAEAVQVLIANTASAEIAQIEKSVKNVKTRNTEIAKRVQILAAAGAELARLEKEAASTAEQKATDAFQARVDLAAAEGNVPEQIRFIAIRIRAIDKLIASGKKEGAALNKLKTERATLRQQREGIQDQQIQDQIALGQSIFDLTKNKNPLVNALNAAIAETRADIRAAKAAGRSTTVLQTELNNFLKQRKGAIEGAKDEVKKQTTAFDLLKEAADTFQQNAGNLINANQPFAGPTGFTADIAQFLIRRQQPAAPPARPTAGASVPPIGLQDQPLIQAIEKLTDAITGKSQDSSAVTTRGTRQSRVWHEENMMARRFQEA